MTRLERDAAYLWDMLDAARQAAEFAAGLDAASLQTDRRTGYAVERALEIIGEAARRVSPETRACHPEIPWAASSPFATSLPTSTAPLITSAYIP